MILDAQHERSASPLATLSDETHAAPHANRPVGAEPPEPATPAESERAQPDTPATNAFEAFGSFSG